VTGAGLPDFSELELLATPAQAVWEGWWDLRAAGRRRGAEPGRTLGDRQRRGDDTAPLAAGHERQCHPSGKDALGGRSSP
jgi:hypothetical protein